MRDTSSYARLALAGVAALAAAGCEPAPPSLSASPVGSDTTDGVGNHDLRLVGQNDLQARSAYQPIVHAYGERRICSSVTMPARH